jgi:hypothetical protein
MVGGLGRRGAADTSERQEGEDHGVLLGLVASNRGETQRSDVEGLLGLWRSRGRLAGATVAWVLQVAGKVMVKGGADGENYAVQHQPDGDPLRATETRHGTHPTQYTVERGCR